jgi:paired amphipathic helix protein Sin3a
MKIDRIQASSESYVDYASCSQYGTSYRSVPRSFIPSACSARTKLCKEVLNDHCILFPTFTDESSSVASKKSVFEEHMYKIEDERFELDIIMEVNLSAIRALESVQLHMNTLSTEHLQHFQLDDYLGGQSIVTQKQAVQRIYGERANEIIDGLKRNPRVAVPIVIKRYVIVFITRMNM